MKTKHILLALSLCCLSLLGRAQDTYEFMIIEFNSNDNEVAISIDFKDFIKESAEYKGSKKSRYNATPLLKYVRKYQEEGWEVMQLDVEVVGPTGNSSAADEIFFAYLRKKKK